MLDRRRPWKIVAVIVTACLAVSPLRAQPASEEDSAAKLERAKALYNSGAEALNANAYTQGLELFLRSRALLPSIQNTQGAAFCLDRLQRFDESLELYEELLMKFGEQLSEDARKALPRRMHELESKLASLAVEANVEGTVVVDGRARGKLPLLAPLRLMPGPHLLRVLKDGYEPFERRLVLTANEPSSIDARLNPVGHAGQLRVDGGAALEGAELYVDGGVVGHLPWDGSLPPGVHVIFARSGDRGFGPREVTVVEGQTVEVRESSSPLGPEVRIVVSPATADLMIDGVRVGRGAFRGRLPLGDHRIEAREDGRVAGVQTVTAGLDAAGVFKETLQVDPRRSRWASDRRAISRLEALGYTGLAIGAAGAVVISIAGGIAISKRNASDRNCVGTLCRDAEGTRLYEDSKTAATVANVALAAASSGAALGTLALLFGRDSAQKTGGSGARLKMLKPVVNVGPKAAFFGLAGSL